MSVSVSYLRFELLRTLRNRRFFLLSLGFPLLLFFMIASSSKHDRNLQGTGLSAPLYFMVSMSSWGTMSAMLSAGARIAGERQVGWHRQLRITPLSPAAYLQAKVVTGYLLALISMGALYAAGISEGVSLPAGRWIEMTLLILIGLVPFAALGILVGHLLNVDSIGPAIGGGTALLALVSGTWFPVTHGFLHDVGQFLPSYWLVQAGHVALGGSAWGWRGWLCVVAWTALLGVLAARAYVRDTARA